MSSAPMEHERRFLVVAEGWPQSSHPRRLTQGYLSTHADRTVRVRRQDESAWLTVKGQNRGGSRPEFEYPIPPEDAEYMLHYLCGGHVIDKWRHLVPAGIPELPGAQWEVDVFLGANQGLTVAELEVETAAQLDIIARHLPPWIGPEITGDHRYANSMLVQRPFTQWSTPGQG